MKTRKDIGDRDGNRSIYVVEARFIDTGWVIYDVEHISESYLRACELKEQLYEEELKAISPNTWTRKDFRVALYERSE